jgi:hypothetical protein
MGRIQIFIALFGLLVCGTVYGKAPLQQFKGPIPINSNIRKELYSGGKVPVGKFNDKQHNPIVSLYTKKLKSKIVVSVASGIDTKLNALTILAA